jgi:regulator of sigma D
MADIQLLINALKQQQVINVNDQKIDANESDTKVIPVEMDHREHQLNTIQSLLTKRQAVLVAMCSLAELELEEVKFSSALEGLKTFSQALVDYSALGHFEIYERIIYGNERRVNVKKIANVVYPLISKTTNKFLAFNDKYDGADDQDSLTNLYKDLSLIAESMADRIESEDKLLNQMNETTSSLAN